MWLFLVTVLFFPSEEIEAWPGFLGPSSETLDAEDLPLRWGANEGIRWMSEIPGHGQSSPVVWGDKIFVSSVEGELKDVYHITCFNRITGEMNWTRALPNSVPVKNSYYVSRSAPTPVVDGSQLICFFESGDMIALAHDGTELWRRDLAKEYGPFDAEFGLGASPCQNADSVFVLIEHDGPSFLLALDKKSGKTIWKTQRKPTRSWSSPAMVSVDGKPHVVVSSGGGVDGYDPVTGDSLWGLEDIGGNTGCTPIDCANGRFLVGAAPGRNGENAGSAANSNCMIQIEWDGNKFVPRKLWVAEGAVPTWASPIFHNGLAYWVNRSGVVYCFDGTSGERVFAERTKQSCWATPFAVGDRIYFFGKDGMTTVIRAGRDFEILAENETWVIDELPKETPLGEEETEERRQASALFSKPTLYGYAVTRDSFIMRVGNALICLGK